MDASIIENFVKEITNGKDNQPERFYEIFSARGFLMEFDSNSGKVRLSRESHIDDCEFLEALQSIEYKKIYKKPHHDSIKEDNTGSAAQTRHAYFDDINTQRYDINDIQYLKEVFTHDIPIELFRLNWERDWYGRFDQFKNIETLPGIRVYDLEPFIARLAKAISSIGISTWSSCEGHWGKPAFIIFDRKYHRIWFQTILNQFITRKLNPVCKWQWLENRCTISGPSGGPLELYRELQEVARLIYDNRVLLKKIKKQVASLLTSKHKGMNKKDLLIAFEEFFETSIGELQSSV